MNIDIFTVLDFAEWININGIRWGKCEWKYKGDKYSKKHLTSKMYVFYKQEKAEAEKLK